MLTRLVSSSSLSQPSRIRVISYHFMSTYTHDFAVIGGGSGGLAAAKEASRAGAKVVLFDYVTKSPHGTQWGFGGTCVNVGCIPKKLFHYSALLGESIHDLKHLGYSSSVTESPHNWSELVETVTNYIRKLNFSYRTGARSAGVEYINARAKFSSGTDEHSIEYIDSKSGETRQVRAKHVLVAVGGRPTLPSSIKGIEHAITSDDIFYNPRAPGKTLVVGGGYIAMECAGFLTGMGYETTVAVRSRPLRNFDHQVAEKIQSVMHEMGTNFLIGTVPNQLAKVGDRIQVTFDNGTVDVFDTVLLATGRTPETRNLQLPKNAAIDTASQKLIANPTTNLVQGTSSIYAVGDCLLGSPELTPVAVKDGEKLARRLFANSKDIFDKSLIPTTVFTPTEYGTVGFSEEGAIEKFGPDNVECYLYEWPSLERAAVHREKPENRRADEGDVEQGNNCFTKLVCVNDKVVGFHFVGPNAGEVTQGFALAVKLGATKADYDSLVGIHPTDAEALCGLTVTKRSGLDYVAAGGCGGGKCG
jgi:thioredoxin reductase (NADPH)